MSTNWYEKLKKATNPTQVSAQETITPELDRSHRFPALTSLFIKVEGDDLIVAPASACGLTLKERALTEELDRTRAQLEDLQLQYKKLSQLLTDLRELSL